ncbi:hypothetical protein CPB85DRAFT_192308 [Mucidula mucida]|nr:hypothetical protein CPB85DRAFT_192308 [Mucidula mucida]
MFLDSMQCLCGVKLVPAFHRPLDREYIWRSLQIEHMRTASETVLFSNFRRLIEVRTASDLYNSRMLMIVLLSPPSEVVATRHKHISFPNSSATPPACRITFHLSPQLPIVMKVEYIDDVVPPAPLPTTALEASPYFAPLGYPNSTSSHAQRCIVSTRVLRSATRRSTAASVSSQPPPLPRPSRVRRVKKEPLAQAEHTESALSLNGREPPPAHGNYVSLCYRRKPVFEFPPGNTYMLEERLRFKALQARRQAELLGLKPSLKKSRGRDDTNDGVKERLVRGRKRVRFGGGSLAKKSKVVSVKHEDAEDSALWLNMHELKLS